MWHWTLKSLVAEPLALLASVAGTASAFLLVMLFEGVYAGESEQVVAYLRHADADVWVMQRGVANMHMASSYLSDSKVAAIREVPGVAAADGILYLNTVVAAAGRQWFAYVVGLDVPSGAGPWAMAAGRAEPGSGEAVVPVIFAASAGLALGDRIRIADRELTIVGLSEGTFSMANSIVFVTRPDLEDIMTSLDIVSFVLVATEAGADPVAVAADIERAVDKVRALPAVRFLANDKELVLQMGVETIALMTLIGATVAALLVAYSVYSHVERQRRELAVAKALGATNAALYASLTLQAVAITVASVVVAVAAALTVMPLITGLIPQVSLELTRAAVARVGVAGIAIGLVASLASARQVARVDPLSAFKGA
jgi:ABC-type antimicrobial peptide transport system permease subunit